MNRLIIQLAFRNLWRNQTRTGMVILMIGCSLAALIFFQGFMDGFIHKMTFDTVGSETSDLTIYHKDYRQNKQLKFRLQDPQKMMSLVQGSEGVAHVFGRLINDGMISSPYYSQGVRVIGLDPDQERKLSILPDRIHNGAYGFPKPNTVWVGMDLADRLRTSLGRKIVVTGQTHSGEIVTEAFRIGAILRTNNPKIDSASIFIPLSQAQSLFQVNDDLTQVSVAVSKGLSLPTIRDSLQTTLGSEVEVLTWREVFGALQFMNDMMSSYNAISYLIIFVIVAIGIVGVILMSVLERVREFGICLAIGQRFRHISIIILWESLIMGSIGTLLGVILGYGILFWFHSTGIDMSQFAANLEQFGMPSIIYPALQWTYMVWAAVCVAITSILAILWPLWILYKLRPIQSITFN